VLRDSSRACDQLAGPEPWPSRKAFQHTERQPAMHGLLGPLNFTARCRSHKLALCLVVSCHRVLRHRSEAVWASAQRGWSYVASTSGLIVYGLLQTG
jgi:hypothetical protein